MKVFKLPLSDSGVNPAILGPRYFECLKTYPPYDEEIGTDFTESEQAAVP